jgi:alpha-ribazole phosphatase
MTLQKPTGEIYLLRHGAIQSKGEPKRYIGQVDVPLSAIGMRQARQWAEYFATTAFDRICCSDLTRSRQTADIIAAGRAREIEPLPALREIHLGDWDGLSYAAVKKENPQEFHCRGADIAEHRPPGGESFRDLAHRIWPAFQQLASRPIGKTLIVGHAGVNRVILCRVLGLPLANLFRIGQEYGALNILSKQPDGWRVQVLNLVPEWVFP